MNNNTLRLNWILPRLLLMLVGFGFAAVLMWIVLQQFPQFQPGTQRFVFRERDGDSFWHQPGFVRPPEGNAVLEDFYVRRDENGFREPQRTADDYQIIVLGDSYSEGGKTPWVDVLAEELDTPVQNLAFRGFGPLQYLEVMRQFGRGDYDWVLIGYFEGNDLDNIRTASQVLAETGQIDINRDPVETAADVGEREIVTNPDSNYLYPLQHTIDGQSYELAYISDYIWWLNGELAHYKDSRNLQELAQILAEVRLLAGDACVGLVYMPHKGHIYFPYANPEGNQRFVLQNALELALRDDGWLGFELTSIDSIDDLLPRFGNQRDAVQTVTETAGIDFIDLTPAFQDRAQSGTPTYYVYDSHWNQSGHNLAGKTVAKALQEMEQCTQISTD